MKRTRHVSARALLAVAVALLGVGVAAGLALARSAAAAKPLKAGIVVIETNLRYAGGQAAGTGMVLTSSGEVLTNNHVIEGATSIKVVVPQSGRSYTASVLGYDVSADTALLKLKGASGLETVSVGTSSTLTRGQVVRAVGNAGGTGRLSTVRGRVTGLAKTITATNDQGNSEQLRGLIETNADVQPGDSGGPLLDNAGRVVGMDTAASAASGGFYFQNVPNDAYAIPIDKAMAVVRQVEAGTSTATIHIGGTAFLGIQVASPGGGYGYGGTPARGTLVTGVVSGSPADTAGLTYGDAITAVDGHSVSSPGTLVSLLLRKHPGDTIKLTWVDPVGNRQTSSVKLAGGPPQ